MMSLDDLASHDPDAYHRIRNTIMCAAQQWAIQQFHQSWAEVREVGDMPVRYSSHCFGYSVVLAMPDHPQREVIEVLVNEDWAIIDIQARIFF